MDTGTSTVLWYGTSTVLWYGTCNVLWYGTCTCKPFPLIYSCVSVVTSKLQCIIFVHNKI